MLSSKIRCKNYMQYASFIKARWLSEKVTGLAETEGPVSVKASEKVRTDIWARISNFILLHKQRLQPISVYRFRLNQIAFH